MDYIMVCETRGVWGHPPPGNVLKIDTRNRANPSSPRTHPKTYLHTTSVFDTGVMGTFIQQ